MPGVDCVKKLVERCKKFNGVVYFHNGGNFDFHFLLEYLPVEHCKFLCIGKRIVQIKTPWGCEFRDSFAIIPKALATYQKTKVNYRWFEKDSREKYKKKILAYLGDDLKDLYNMVSGFMDRFPPEITLASATSKILKKDFGGDLGRSDEEYDTAMRPYYFAGRVQFWQLGRIRGKCHIVDINSAFPWAMTLPHVHGTDFRMGKKMPKKNAEQSFVTVTCDSDGELPLRKEDGGVDFPKGRHTFHVTGWEYLAALELKKIRNVEIETVLTPKKTKDFEKFVRYYYDGKVAAKRREDKEEEFFYKIVLNAGYGRMALNCRRYSEVCVTSIYDTPPEIDGKGKKQKEANAALAGWKVKWDDPARGLTFHCRKSYRAGFDKFVNVATAASITGAVRAFLMRSKEKCKGVVYCDTDSLAASDISRLKQSEQLGAWKLEMTFAGTNKDNSLWIAGKKLYAGQGRTPKGKRKWKLASKGVRLSAKKIIAVARGEQRTHVSIAPTYSVFSPPKFVSRLVRRADQMGKKPI